VVINRLHSGSGGGVCTCGEKVTQAARGRVVVVVL
jgi:hypothetical protein